MATLVQQTAELFSDISGSIAPSITGVTAGNLVVMLVACSQNGSATALTAPAGWSTAASATGPGSGTFRQCAAIFYKENAASGSHSGTVTGAAGSYWAATIIEFSGAKTSGALEGTNTNSGNGVTTGSTNSASNTTANALVISIICCSNDSGNMTGLSSPASSGYTNIDGELTDSLHTGYQFSYKNASSVASQSGSWTWTSSSGFGAVIATFGDGGSPPAITVQPTDQIANAGATATFTVTETGATSYQWKRNGSNVGTSSNSYTTPAVAYSDQGAQYTVDCINTNGTTTSSAATLRVAWNLSGTGPRVFPGIGGVIGAGTVDSWVRATATSGGGATVNGQTLTAVASVIAGSVTAAALVDAQVITVVASAIAGTVQAAATIAGQLLTSTASVIAGTVTGAAVVDGQTLTATASVLAGTASGGGAATVNGQTITATASVIAGAVTGAAVVDGQLLTVSANVLPGGAFVPSSDPMLQSKALRTGIGMGL